MTGIWLTFLKKKKEKLLPATILKKTGPGDFGWILLAQHSVLWLAFINSVINLRIPRFLISGVSSSSRSYCWYTYQISRDEISAQSVPASRNDQCGVVVVVGVHTDVFSPMCQTIRRALGQQRKLLAPCKHLYALRPSVI